MAGLKSRNTIQTGGISGRDENASKTYAFRNGKNYSVIKKFTKPTNPNTLSQQLVRQSFSNLSAKWSQLTDAQRESWNRAAASTQWQNADNFGGNTSITGKALYVGVNTRLLSNGLNEILTATISPVIVTDGTVITDLVFTPSNAFMDLQCTSGNVNEIFIISLTAPFSSGTNPNNKKTTILLSANDVLTTNGETTTFVSVSSLDLGVKYIAKFGNVAQGQKLKAEVYVINAVSGFFKKVASESITVA